MNKKVIIPSITQTEGAYLVRDFQIFMEFLFSEGGYLTKKNRQIAPKFLYPLNQQMTYSYKDATPGTKQPTYHELHLLQHLAEGAKLYEMANGPNGNFKMIPTDRYRQFCTLTETEQYFTLLETLWTNVDWLNLFDGSFGKMVMENLQQTLNILCTQKTGVKIPITHGEGDTEINVAVSLLDNFAAYLSYFGFWKVERDDNPENPYTNKGDFKVQSITVNDFGKQMMKYIIEYRAIPDWNVSIDANRKYADFMSDLFSGVDKIELHTGVRLEKGEKKTKTTSHSEPFIQPFQAIFPENELQKTLSQPIKEWRSGAYTFKVSIGRGIWRKISMRDLHTLHDLHQTILEAFDFDNDHLYAFYMDGQRFSDDCYNDPTMGEPRADGVMLGDLDLVEGQDFLYLYDFGDEWHFKVKLEKINPQNKGPELAMVIDGKGEAPVQYGW